ncbi:MAG: flagellar motor switch protein FliN [Planctomycetota bacterium]
MSEETPPTTEPTPDPTAEAVDTPAPDAAAPEDDAGAAPIDSSDMDALMEEMAEDAPASEEAPAAETAPATEAAAEEPVASEAGEVQATDDDSAAMLNDEAIAALLQEASFEDSGSPSATAIAAGAEALNLPDFSQVVAGADAGSIDLLRDVDLNVKIELGRSRMSVEDVLKLIEGSVVELDKLAGDPVDVFINERLVARGEVLVLNDNFCVRVNEIVQAASTEAA